MSEYEQQGKKEKEAGKKPGFLSWLFDRKEKRQPEIVLFTDENGNILKDQTLQEKPEHFGKRRENTVSVKQSEISSDDEKTLILEPEADYEPTIYIGNSADVLMPDGESVRTDSEKTGRD